MDSYRHNPSLKVNPGETHILFAEDGVIYARILWAVLTKAGYKFSWIDDGAAAYEIIKGGFRPSLLITDVMMPGMSGFELVTRLKSENILPPTIVLTGLQKEEEVLRGLQCGADDYVKKPFSPSVLLARVQIVLSRYNNTAA
jgi:two-component system alkaline phosphatase synthesis response regulator PhoP